MKVGIAMTEANDEAQRLAVIAAAWDASDRAFEKARAARSGRLSVINAAWDSSDQVRASKLRAPKQDGITESRLLEFRDDQLRADNGRWITEKDIKDAVNDIGKASEILQSVEDPDKREIVAQALKDEGMTKDNYEKAVKGMGSAGDGGSGAIDALTLKDKLPLNDYGTPSGTLAIGPVKVKAYRTGDVTNNGQGGVFFSGDAEGAEEYRSLHNDEPVVGYEVELQNPILVGHQGDLTRKYFKKPYGEMMDSYQLKYGRKGADVATGKFDAALIAAVKKDGHDGIIYVAPAPPAKTEVVVFGKSEKDFARVKPMKASSSSGTPKPDDYDAIAKSVEGSLQPYDSSAAQATIEDKYGKKEFAYHGTTTANLPSILRDGLKPRGGQGASQDKVQNNNAKVNGTIDAPTARQAAAIASEASGSKPVVLVYKRGDDETKSANNKTTIYHDSIAPDRIAGYLGPDGLQSFGKSEPQPSGSVASPSPAAKQPAAKPAKQAATREWSNKAPKLASDINGGKIPTRDGKPVPVKKVVGWHVTKRENVDSILKDGFDVSKINPRWNNDLGVSLSTSSLKTAAKYMMKNTPDAKFDANKYAVLEVDVSGRSYDMDKDQTLGLGTDARGYTRDAIQKGFDLRGGAITYVYNDKAIKSVKLVTADQMKATGLPIDGQMLESVNLLEFREDQLRDDRGQWTVEGEIEDAASDVSKASELLDKFVKPENREKIAAALKDAGMKKEDYDAAVAAAGSDKDGEPGGNAKVLEWARKKFGDETKAANFAKWFGESRVVDKNNNPAENFDMGDVEPPVIAYHGTSVGGWDEFDPNKAGAATAQGDGNGLLYGPGFYFTEDKEVADSYSKLNPKQVFKTTATQQDVDNMLAKAKDNIDVEYKEWIKAGMEMDGLHLKSASADIGSFRKELSGKDPSSYTQDDLRKIKNLAEIGNVDTTSISQGSTSETKAVYLAIKKPFDIAKGNVGTGDGKVIADAMRSGKYKTIDSRAKLQGDNAIEKTANFIEKGGEDLVSSSFVYDELAGYYGKTSANQILKEAGYDGITHTGGAVTGGRPHKVWIAFVPNQVKSATSNKGTFSLDSNSINEGLTPVQLALLESWKDYP
jgi:hypothetical protein